MSIAIDQAFTSAMLAGGLEIDLVFENGVWAQWNGSAYVNKVGAYTPATERPFAELITFPASKDALSIKDSDESVGLFQVTVKYPADTGAINAKTKAESVLSLMKVGQSITYQTQTVYITSHSRLGGRVEGGFYQIVVRANYRAFVTR